MLKDDLSKDRMMHINYNAKNGCKALQCNNQEPENRKFNNII